jgi:hypothetical protein
MALYEVRYSGYANEAKLKTALVVAPSAQKAREAVSHLIRPEDAGDYLVTVERTTGTRLLFASDEW